MNVNVAQIQKEARFSERQRLRLTIQGMINGNNPRDAYTQEDVNIKMAQNQELQRVLDVLDKLDAGATEI